MNFCLGWPESIFPGIIVTIGKMKKGEIYDGLRRLRTNPSPAKSLREYAKFMLDPVLVHFAPNARGGAINPDKLDHLIDFFEEELVKALSERYQVVDKPGPGVLRLRAAITDVQPTWPMYHIDPRTKTFDWLFGMNC